MNVSEFNKDQRNELEDLVNDQLDALEDLTSNSLTYVTNESVSKLVEALEELDQLDVA